MTKRFIALIMCVGIFLGTCSQVFAAEIEDKAALQEEAYEDETNEMKNFALVGR